MTAITVSATLRTAVALTSSSVAAVSIRGFRARTSEGVAGFAGSASGEAVGWDSR